VRSTGRETVENAAGRTAGSAPGPVGPANVHDAASVTTARPPGASSAPPPAPDRRRPATITCRGSGLAASTRGERRHGSTAAAVTRGRQLRGPRRARRIHLSQITPCSKQRNDAAARVPVGAEQRRVARRAIILVGEITTARFAVGRTKPALSGLRARRSAAGAARNTAALADLPLTPRRAARRVVADRLPVRRIDDVGMKPGIAGAGMLQRPSSPA
jgi:hypothetical protein